jgi:hypothetical protein
MWLYHFYTRKGTPEKKLNDKTNRMSDNRVSEHVIEMKMKCGSSQ